MPSRGPTGATICFPLTALVLRWVMVAYETKVSTLIRRRGQQFIDVYSYKAKWTLDDLFENDFIVAVVFFLSGSCPVIAEGFVKVMISVI